MRAVFYGRFSTDMQKESSISDQYRNCARYAEREGWEIIARYEDRAISGSVRERPEYQRMLADAEAGKFDILLVDDLSRLSRDSGETSKVLKKFKFHGIRLIAPSDGFDTAVKGHKITGAVKGLFNEIFLDDLAEKVHRGLSGLALKGFNCGGRTYGYKHIRIFDPIKKDAYGEPVQIGAKREVDPEQARWVVQIFEWYAEGRSPRWIANELNKLEVPAPRSRKHWMTSTIYGDAAHGTGLLNNPLYIGRYIWNRGKFLKNPDNGSHKRIERPQEEWIIREMPELRIVSAALWDKVKARQSAQAEKSKAVTAALHANARTGAGGKYIFSGLLRCGTCGSNFVIINQTQYGCSGRVNKGASYCSNSLKVSRKVVEARLLESIRSELFNEEALALFIKEANRLLSEKQRQKAGVKDDQSRRLAQVEEEISNIMTAIRAGILTHTTKTELEKAEAEKRELERALAHKPGLDKVTAFLPRAVDTYKRLVGDLEHTLQSDIIRARCQLKNLLGDEIRLIPEDDGLVAEIKGDYAGLLSLAAPKISMAGGLGFEPR